ncbi:hypothetical protein Tco_1307730 [Tanacetum coccineum]
MELTPLGARHVHRFCFFTGQGLPAGRGLGSRPNSSAILSSSIGSAESHLGIVVVIENIVVVIEIIVVVMENIMVAYFLGIGNFGIRVIVGFDVTQVVRLSIAFQTHDTVARKNLSFVTMG